MSIEYDHDHENEIIFFAETNFRNQKRRFGIKTDDRRRHMYIVGKTGMGKTTLLENLVIQDIQKGHGLAYLDPHGDTAEKILNYIPSHRMNDVVYFNPGDQSHPVGFNVLEQIDPDKKHLVAAGLMGVFKKIWPDVWSARMEYIMMNCILALLEMPDATLLGISRILADKSYRDEVVSRLQDPIVKGFWRDEFAGYSEKYATEAIAPIQNKVGQFLSASIIRNIVSQVKSTFNVRTMMDEGKILIVNLSKGKVGEDNSFLLGGMIVTKIQLAAMERVDIKEEADRRDFYLYVDEFQNFATESFAVILSEARKYHLNLIVAHQYIAQLEQGTSTAIRDAVFGNVGTLIVMRVGAEDAEFLEREFMPVFEAQDLVNLTKFNIYLRLMIDGAASQPFSACCLPPISAATDSYDKVIRVSRERYGIERNVIEEKIIRFRSSMESSIDTTKKAVVSKKKDKPKIVAKCSDCGKDFSPPFRPTGDKPVFCSDCFLNHKQTSTVQDTAQPIVKTEIPQSVLFQQIPHEVHKTVAKKVSPPFTRPLSSNNSHRNSTPTQSRARPASVHTREQERQRPSPQNVRREPISQEPPASISIADALKTSSPPKSREYREKQPQRQTRARNPQTQNTPNPVTKNPLSSISPPVQQQKDSSSEIKPLQNGDVVKF